MQILIARSHINDSCSSKSRIIRDENQLSTYFLRYISCLKIRMETCKTSQFCKTPTDHKIIVPKLETIKPVYHRAIPIDAIVNVQSLIKQTGKWLVYFSAKLIVNPKCKRSANPPPGVDMGLINFSTRQKSDSTAMPKYYRQKEKQLKR